MDSGIFVHLFVCLYYSTKVRDRLACGLLKKYQDFPEKVYRSKKCVILINPYALITYF